MSPRIARLRAPAKINLALKVLYRRPDGYHELRTIFQTISLADLLEIEFTPGRRTSIALESEIDIPDNLVLRAAEAVLRAGRVKGTARFRLTKQIPMGGGLGGGSTDAAAVLLALPVLAGIDLSRDRLSALAADLGSDVPFFLAGGTALGIGRGTELYPLPDFPSRPGVIVAPPVHVSTPDAYRALAREPWSGSLTKGSQSFNLNTFQAQVWGVSEGKSQAWENDFEAVVFKQHPRLASVKRKLRKAGAGPAMLTGSGAALFGLFATPEERKRVLSAFTAERVFPIRLISRRQYQSLWWKQLHPHMREKTWPPRSRYLP